MPIPDGRSPKAALVTGGAHRLGRYLALELGRRGYRVAVHFRSLSGDAGETLRLLREAGSDGVALPADLSEPGAPAALVSRAVAALGGLDALVHSASPWVEGPVESVTFEEWESVFSVGPRAAFFLVQAALPHLRAARGSVLLVSDVAARQAWPGHVPHAVAKAAVEALVRNLAVALGPGVRVNGVAPGIVLPPASLPEADVARLVARTPLRRPVPPEELAFLAATLLESPSVTGQVLSVDAGRSAAG